MGHAFAKAAKQPPVDLQTLQKTLDQLREVGILKVAENGSLCGVLGALCFPNFWNENEIIAQELFWWVDIPARGTSAGIRLLQAVEDECRDRGAKKLLMLALDDLEGEKVAGLYRKRGYEPQERSFRKLL